VEGEQSINSYHTFLSLLSSQTLKRALPQQAGYPHRMTLRESGKINSNGRVNKLMNNFSLQSIYTWYRNMLRNPKYRWWIILGTLAYIFSPIDISPDIFPIVGQIDDVLLLTLLISELSQLVVGFVKTRKEQKVVAKPSDSSNETVDVDAVSVSSNSSNKTVETDAVSVE